MSVWWNRPCGVDGELPLVYSGSTGGPADLLIKRAHEPRGHLCPASKLAGRHSGPRVPCLPPWPLRAGRRPHPLCAPLPPPAARRNTPVFSRLRTLLQAPSPWLLKESGGGRDPGDRRARLDLRSVSERDREREKRGSGRDRHRAGLTT